MKPAVNASIKKSEGLWPLRHLPGVFICCYLEGNHLAAYLLFHLQLALLLCTTVRAEFRARLQWLATGRALIRRTLLRPAMRAEFGTRGKRLTALGAKSGSGKLCPCGRLCRRGVLRCLQALGKHLPHGHACAHAHTHARRTTGIIGRFPHGFRRLILGIFTRSPITPMEVRRSMVFSHFFR